MALRSIWTPAVVLSRALMIGIYRLREAQLGAQLGRFAAEVSDDLGNVTTYEGDQVILPDGTIVEGNTDFSPINQLQSLSLDLSVREARLNAQLSIPLRKDSNRLVPAIQFTSEGAILLLPESNLPVMDSVEEVLFAIESGADSVGVGSGVAILAEPEPFKTTSAAETQFADQASLQPYRPIVSAAVDLVRQVKTVTLQIPVGIAGSAEPVISGLLDFDDGL